VTILLQAAGRAVRLEGDVITANGSIISGHIPREMTSSLAGSLTSVCSCRCPKCPINFLRGPRPPRRLNLTKSPAKITHLHQSSAYDRKSMSVAVYHRNPHPSSGTSGTATSTSILRQSAPYHGHMMPSDSMDFSSTQSPSPVLELYDSPYKDSSKRMSV